MRALRSSLVSSSCARDGVTAHKASRIAIPVLQRNKRFVLIIGSLRVTVSVRRTPPRPRTVYNCAHFCQVPPTAQASACRLDERTLPKPFRHSQTQRRSWRLFSAWRTDCARGGWNSLTTHRFKARLVSSTEFPGRQLEPVAKTGGKILAGVKTVLQGDSGDWPVRFLAELARRTVQPALIQIFYRAVVHQFAAVL